jgi:hypothetical protein
MTDDTCREAFEAWRFSKGDNPFNLRRNDEYGHYENLAISCAYQAWQAAWNTRASQTVTELMEAIEWIEDAKSSFDPDISIESMNEAIKIINQIIEHRDGLPPVAVTDEMVEAGARAQYIDSARYHTTILDNDLPEWEHLLSEVKSDWNKSARICIEAALKVGV